MSAHVCPEYDDTDPTLMLFATGGLDGKRHLIGWAVCAVLAALSTAISFLLMYRHAKNYTKPSEQRHIMRIVAMIPIYAICSALSYRFYKHALYFETIRDCYEAFVIYSFFILLLTYLGDDNESQRSKITGSDRRRLLYPLNCFFFNPLHENFLHYMKHGILQYVAIKPMCTLAALVLEYYGLYCETVYDWHFGMVYITIINFISVSVALYCLVLFYQTIKDEIQDHDPFMKFMCVKMVVFFCYWQTCLLSLFGTLGWIVPQNHWTIINVELGISSLLICTEMIVFSILHVYSFSYRPYVIPGVQTPVFKSLQDGFNPMDMIREILWACTDFCLLISGKPLPVRDGLLSVKLKRAHTIRIRKVQRFFKSRKPTAPNHVDPRIEEIYQSTLEAEARSEALEQQNQPQHQQDEQQAVLASLLGHSDGLNYQSTSRV